MRESLCHLDSGYYLGRCALALVADDPTPMSGGSGARIDCGSADYLEVLKDARKLADSLDMPIVQGSVADSDAITGLVSSILHLSHSVETTLLLSVLR